MSRNSRCNYKWEICRERKSTEHLYRYMEYRYTCTAKQGYSEHAYNEFTLTVKYFSFPVNFFYMLLI